MALHEENGLSEIQSTGLGQAIISSVSRGLSESSSSDLGRVENSIESHGMSEGQVSAFGRVGVAPGVASVVATQSTKIRVTFDAEMANDSALIDLDNYAFTPLGNGVSIYKVSIEAEGSIYPSYVDITVSEMTANRLYQLGVETSTGGPVDRYGDNVGSGKATKTFFGVGTAPEVKYVESLGLNSAKVVFSESMEDNATIRDETNYSFDNGLTVSSVIDVSSSTVFLETSEQAPGLLYTLTITN